MGIILVEWGENFYGVYKTGQKDTRMGMVFR